MKKFMMLAAAIFPLPLFSQMGINSSNPKATFDVYRKSLNINLNGIILPEL